MNKRLTYIIFTSALLLTSLAAKAQVTVHGNVYGGGNAANVKGSCSVLIDQDGARIEEDVFGGGALAKVNITEAPPADPSHTDGATTSVTLTQGTVDGSIFGGGLGRKAVGEEGQEGYVPPIAADVYGPVTVTVNGGSVTNVYGCNDLNGTPKSTVVVTVNGSAPTTDGVYAIKGVYGGGNQAAYTYTEAPVVTVNGCNTSIEDVYGGGNAAPVPATNVIINGGDINRVFAGGNGESGVPAHVGYNTTDLTPSNDYGPGTAALLITNGSIQQVFGGSNSNGAIRDASTITVEKGTAGCEMHISQLFGGGNMADGKAATITIGCTGDYENNGEGISQLYGGANEADVDGNILLNITGGRIDEIFGGNNKNGDIDGTITINVEITNTTCDDHIGNVYGGGNQAAYTAPTGSINYPEINIKHGTIWGSVFGGGFGDETHLTSAGVVRGNPQITIGDDNVDHQVTIEGSVFGGGANGDVDGIPVVHVLDKCNTRIGTYTIDPSDGSTFFSDGVYGGGDAANVNGTNVTIDGGIIGQVFGGGHGIQADPDIDFDGVSANVNGNVSVAITGGTIGQVFAGSNLNGSIRDAMTLDIDKSTALEACDMKIGEVYGGGNEAAGNAGTINVGCTGTWTTTGEYNHTNHNSTTNRIGYELEGIGTVYGGANKANIGATGEGNESNITLNINSGIVDTVFGGNNQSGTIYGTITVNIEKDNEASCAPNWYVGNVFGGGNLAQYTSPDDGEGNPTYPHVNILNGTVSGNVYGGGKGKPADHTKGQVTGNPVVTIGDNTVGHESYVAAVAGSVFGGGDAGNVVGTPVVNVVEKCNTTITTAVYGGGNAADVSATDVTINGGTIGDVFGGGNGAVAAANVTGATGLVIHGGTISRVFSGGNTSGTIGTNSGVTIDHTSSCNQSISEVYGGGNLAAGNAGTISIGCTAVNIGDVYGGANNASIANDIELNITGGQINNVFGGNNTGGTISGGITVNINKHSECSNFSVNNVYGGGNQAPYTIPSGKALAVNILNGTVSQSVYGGGKGSAAIVTGDPVVTVGDAVAAHCAIVTQNVYGGGDAAAVTGNTHVTYNDNNASSTVAKLFGGGNNIASGGVSGTAQVDMTLGTVTTGVYGGCNTSGNVGGDITVNITGGTIGSSSNLAGPSYITADVFGGGFGADTRVNGDVEVNIGTSPETQSDYPKIYGDVYGGSALGQVNDAASDLTTVNILNGTLHSEIDNSSGFPVYYGGNVYGGGLGEAGASNVTKGQVNGTVTVNIGSGTVATSGDYIGYTTTDNTGNATIEGNVYGCNNTNGSPQQDVTVNIFKTAHNTTNTYGYNPSTNGNVPATYALNNVFGGGNAADFQVTGKTATVNIYGCDNTIKRTFGGGNAAATNEVKTMIQGGHVNEAFGGGNGEVTAADVNGRVTLAVHGGTVDRTFAGSNQHGTITGPSSVTIDGASPCPDPIIDELFMGSNYSDWVGDIEATVTCAEGMQVRSLYGGCKQANVVAGNGQSGNVHLTVKGGTYHYIYGGSQGTPGPSGISADIAGNVILDIYGCTLDNTIFGDNETPAIFGGSHINGTIGGKIVVTVDYDPTNQCALDVSKADVYGGGNQADYTAPYVSGSSGPRQDYPVVNIKRATVNNVFGGGLEADVTGNPRVAIWKYAKVLGNVYGGGNQGEVTGNPKVIVNGEKAGKLE